VTWARIGHLIQSRANLRSTRFLEMPFSKLRPDLGRISDEKLTKGRHEASSDQSEKVKNTSQGFEISAVSKSFARRFPNHLEKHT